MLTEVAFFCSWVACTRRNPSDRPLKMLQDYVVKVNWQSVLDSRSKTSDFTDTQQEKQRQYMAKTAVPTRHKSGAVISCSLARLVAGLWRYILPGEAVFEPPCSQAHIYSTGIHLNSVEAVVCTAHFMCIWWLDAPSTRFQSSSSPTILYIFWNSKVKFRLHFSHLSIPEFWLFNKYGPNNASPANVSNQHAATRVKSDRHHHLPNIRSISNTNITE